MKPLILNTTNKSIVVDMSGAAATNNPDFSTHYGDSTSTTFLEGSNDGTLNGTSEVELVAAPASSTQRIINSIIINNVDTAAVTLTISYKETANLRTIWSGILQVGDVWTLEGVYNNNGSLKTTQVGSTTLSDVLAFGDVTGANDIRISDGQQLSYLVTGDADTVLFDVGVTGTPTLSWDESVDAFKFNKPIRVLPIVTSETSSATPTINTDDSDVHRITALALAITSMTTNLSGTPAHGQKLIVEILDNATPRAITWGASFRSTVAGTLPTTTTTSKLLRVGLMWDSADSIWECVAVSNEV